MTARKWLLAAACAAALAGCASGPYYYDEPYYTGRVTYYDHYYPRYGYASPGYYYYSPGYYAYNSDRYWYGRRYSGG
jgi:hypothetical protein